jgi:hypothetical protein
MDDFRLLPNLTNDDLYNINRVRIFLNVTTLSDITDGSGIHITEDAFAARPLSDRTSPLRWPRQPIITAQQRNLWKTALESVYTSWGRKLHLPLGHWMGFPNQTWSGIYNTVSKTITFTNQQTHSIQHYLVLQESRWHLTATARPTPCGDWDPATQDWQTNIPVTLV